MLYFITLACCGNVIDMKFYRNTQCLYLLCFKYSYLFRHVRYNVIPIESACSINFGKHENARKFQPIKYYITIINYIIIINIIILAGRVPEKKMIAKILSIVIEHKNLPNYCRHLGRIIFIFFMILRV